jgi:LPS export ABC transporter protein LptC
VKGRLLAGSALLVVLGLAFLMGHEGRTPGARGEQPASSGDFGFIAQDARVIQTADDGKPLYRLDAARVEQDPASGNVTAQGLTLRYATDDSRNWTLTARNAQLPGGSSLLHLQGDVLITGLPVRSTIPARIETQRLDYDTRSQDVHTREDIRIDWGRQRIDARGLTANLKQGQLALESKVHARFLP